MSRSPGDDERTPPSSLSDATQSAQRHLAADGSLVDSLQGVATAGCTLLQGCKAASITILEHDRPMTITSTNETALAMDGVQYREGDGPCLRAAREQRIVRIDDAGSALDWSAYAEVAKSLEVCSSLSVPLVLLDPATFGGLNFYGGDGRAFDEGDELIAEGFAAQASMVVSNALAYWGAFDQATNLTLAMEHRAEIEQAKGILMATQRCTPDEAFDLLRRASQRENRKLRDIAGDLVRRTIEGTSS